MRILNIVQRYGETIAGGAEQYCRETSERMARRDHHVEVLTTCARSYVDWADEYEPGESTIEDVRVHRFRVAAPRDNNRFSALNRRMVQGSGPRPLFLQREWMREQGPWSPDLVTWLERNAHRFDVVVCYTYLYWTTWAALEAVRGRGVPLVVHSTIHDEPPLRHSLFDAEFRIPDAFAMATPEEIGLIRRRFHFDPPGAVCGIGVEVAADAADPARFRAAYDLGSKPYLLYVGRIDEGKGALALVDYFIAYKDRHPDDALMLAVVGDDLIEIAKRDDIIGTGFVDFQMRDDAIAGALALAQPSFFESFSMILTEAFAFGRPALVEGKCEVLRGHAHRSNAAIPYDGFAEFECALEMLRNDPALADAMGAAGKAYVEREYSWDAVLERYEDLLAQTLATSPRRASRTRS
ncbi:MAG TPA: glycosyltransferase family 4 protein [Acidimicrobiia bacterium]|nr:glycosyltransferase family 4 protein [Acidimicrobiia bacterium]